MARKLYLSDLQERYGAPKGTVLAWRRRGLLPVEDGTEADRGHVRPYWFASTLRDFQPPRERSGSDGKSA